MYQLNISRDKLTDFCRQNDVDFLGVFGSAARGEARPSSDVDLLVRFSQPKSLLELVKLERQFKALFGQEVDLITEGFLSPYIKDMVMADLHALYGTPR